MVALSLKEFYHKYGTGVPNSWEQCEQIWNAATKYADENRPSLQPLKAEILPLIDEAIGDLKLGHVENAAHWLNQISAKLLAV